MEDTKGKHLTLLDRREIEDMLNKGYKIGRIAVRLGKTYNAIKYEIKQHSRVEKTRARKPQIGKTNNHNVNNPSSTTKTIYNAEVAHHKAYTKRHFASFRGKKILRSPALCQFIDKSLLSFQSPEAIAGRLRTGIEGLPFVSRSTIEEYLNSAWGEHIRVELKKFKKKYRRKTNHNKKPALDGRVFIDERPKEITNRERVGDVEMDFIVSGKGGAGYLLTVCDRKARKSFVRKLYPVTFENLKLALIQIKKEFKELKSITTDNDLLLSQHNILSEVLEVPIYFCHPYSSWEKGTIENLNKFIRRFIRKGSDIHTYSTAMIQKIEELANSRFMKVLSYLTPNEFYQREVAETQ